MSSLKFRKDINGLRAYAVVSVLLFHFKIIGFQAGFFGVDVFFVISGFLMTAIVTNGLLSGKFDLVSFYIGRVRRIVPVLLVLIVSLLLLAWFWLPTPDYKALGAQSAYSLPFISNVYFWNISGYFDTSAQEKWLLHTWTLGVEFQFYILLPLFMIAFYKIKRNDVSLIFGMLVVTFLSFLLSVIFSGSKPNAAFYLLPFRTWEFCLGGLIYLLSGKYNFSIKYKSLFLYIGFFLLLISFFVITINTSWPSYWALFPTLGTALIILSQNEKSIFTAHPIAQWLGDRSYSIYLWHWPIVVALYFIGLQDSYVLIVVGLSLSLLLGHLSFLYIETPTRQGLSRLNLRKQFCILLACVSVVGLSAISVRLFTFDGRLPSNVELAAAEAQNKEQNLKCWADGYGGGNYGCELPIKNGSLKKILYKGDSHSLALRAALIDALQESEFGKVIYWGMSACHNFTKGEHSESAGRDPKICNKMNNDFYDFALKNDGNTILIVDRTNLNVHGYNEHGLTRQTPQVSFSVEGEFEEVFINEYVNDACKLSDNNELYLMRPIPEMIVDVPNTLARNIIFRGNDKDLKLPIEDYKKRNQLVWKAQDLAQEKCGVHILDPLPYLCDEEYCYGSIDGRPLYSDDNHLSQYGSKFLLPMFKKIYNK